MNSSEDIQPNEQKGLLAAVQELKSQHYIGTQEAYYAVKRYSAVEDVPLWLAGLINDGLKDWKIGYHATPGRLLGIGEIIRFVAGVLRMHGTLDEHSYTSLESGRPSLGTLALLTQPEEESELVNMMWPFGDINKDSSKRLRRTAYDGQAVKIYRNLFSKARNRGVQTDPDLIDILKEELRGDLNSTPVVFLTSRKTVLGESVEEITYPFLGDRVASRIGEHPFEKSFLPQCYSHRRDEIFDEINCTSINLGKVVERLKNDCLDHSLEYRRSALAQFLGDVVVRDYDDAVKCAEHMISSEMSEATDMKERGYDAETINDALRNAQAYRFIRHVLGSEKNFAKKFLGQ